MNNLYYLYLWQNEGIPNLGFYKIIQNSYVTTFNNVNGDVYGLYSVTIGNNKLQEENGKIQFYGTLTTYLEDTYQISQWAKHTNQQFYKKLSGNNNQYIYPRLFNSPELNKDPNIVNPAIIDIGTVDNFFKSMLSNKDPLTADIDILTSKFQVNATLKTNQKIVHVFDIIDSKNNILIIPSSITWTGDKITITLTENLSGKFEIYYTTMLI